jgi:hypothetical protein
MRGRITIATRMHHGVGPLLIYTYTCVSGWSNTKGAASAHPSDSVPAVGTMQYGQHSILFTIFSTNVHLVLITSRRCHIHSGGHLLQLGITMM